MADQTTTNFGLTLPGVGSSDGSWGGKINDNFDIIDDLLGKSLKAPAAIGDLPSIADRAGKVFAFDAEGNPTTVVVSDTSDSSLRTDLAADGGSNLINWTSDIAGAVARSVAEKLSELAVSPEDFGAIANGTADDSGAIQDALDAIASGSGRGILRFTPGRTYKMLSGITVNVSKVFIDGLTSILDFSAMISGTAVTVTGSDSIPYKQNQNLQNFPQLIGPGISSSVDGYSLNDPDNDNSGPSHLIFIAPNVSSFRYGIILKNRGYLLKVIGGSFYDNNYCVWQDSAIDGSENNRFDKTTFFNSNWVAKVTDVNADLHFDGCSMDAMDRLFDIQQGVVTLNDPHVEQVGTVSTYSDIPIILGSEYSRFYWLGGSRRVPAGAARSYSHWTSLAAGSLFVDNCRDALSDESSTGEFATGDGTLIRESIIGSTDVRDNCWIANSTKSRVADPTFATLTTNCLYVSNPASRYVDSAGNSISVTANELKATKTTAATNAFQFVMLLPAKPNELMGGVITYRKPGAQGGSMAIDAVWGRLDPVADGTIPSVPKQLAYANNAITVPTSAVADTDVSLVPLSSHRAPAWANCWLMVVTMTGMDAGDIFFKNPNFDKVG